MRSTIGTVEDAATADAAVVVHAWLEPHDDVLRGRLVVPVRDGPTAARGVDGLVAVVRDALEAIERDLRAERRDAGATGG